MSGSIILKLELFGNFMPDSFYFMLRTGQFFEIKTFCRNSNTESGISVHTERTQEKDSHLTQDYGIYMSYRRPISDPALPGSDQKNVTIVNAFTMGVVSSVKGKGCFCQVSQFEHSWFHSNAMQDNF